MSSSPSWNQVLTELNQDITRDSPRDVLQWGADWFQARLRSERLGQTDPSSAGSYNRTMTAIPPSMQHFLPHSPSPFSEHPPSDSPFAPRRATEPANPTSSTASSNVNRNVNANGGGSAPIFGSPFTALNQPFYQPPAPGKYPEDMPIPAHLLGRRTSVSAESLVPSAQRHFSTAGGNLDTLEEGDDNAIPVYPKTDEQLKRIKGAIKPNFLFRNLDEEQEHDVLAAMKEIKVDQGAIVIQQGDTGDYFYIVEAGTLDVYLKRVGQMLDIDKGDHPQMGKKVAVCEQDSSFGELALMHNAPRAASVVAMSPCTLWALDRVTFRTILLDHTSRKRRLYESFLAEVPILATLQPQERAKIADVLETRTFLDGQDIVKEGEEGEDFFLIESGQAVALKKGESGEDELVKQYGKGDYFGELALLNHQVRAATVRAKGPEKLRVAALGEQAFTRLLGPAKDIMARTAGERYAPAPVA